MTHAISTHINNTAVTIDNSLRSKSGTFIKFYDYAKSKGFSKPDKDDKEGRKALKPIRKEYDALRRSFYVNNRKVAAVAVASPEFDIKKFKVDVNADNKVVGFTVAGRSPTKSDAKANGNSSALAEKDARIAELEAKLNAILAALPAPVAQ